MSLIQILLPLMVTGPLLGAATALVAGRFPRVQAVISVSVLSAAVIVAAVLLLEVDGGASGAVEVGAWPAPWGIVLVVDRLSAIMLLVSALMLLGVLVFSIGQGIADGDRETPVSIFNPSYLILSAGLFNTFIAGDLFNMYVGFEIMLAASYVLLTLGGTGARIRAGVTYIVISLISSVFFLAAIAMLYGATGTVNMAQLAVRIAELPADVVLMLHLMLLLGFAIKAAVFPMSFWLPDSYPTAPAPVTAVFAGLLTKVGVYAIIRTETLLFPGGDLMIGFMVVALLTMIIGILGATVQADIKRLLSFTLVSHIGYMIFGIGLSSHLGMTSTIYYVIHHITVQTTLFLAVGLVERIGGTTSIVRLSGMMKAAPFIAILFFIPALNLGGIPPFSGFIGKAGLFLAGADTGGWLIWVLLGGGALTSLLTLYALTRVWNMAFWRSREEQQEGYQSPLLEALQEAPEDDGTTVTTRTTPRLMVAATVAMVGLTVALTVFAGPLFELSDRASDEVQDNSEYISLVYPEGVR